MPIARDDPREPGCALLALKVVPGARRDQIVGPLGDRLKVRVSAPPEGGHANKAVCALVAGALGLKRAGVEVVAGASGPEKTLRVRGLDAESLEKRWGPTSAPRDTMPPRSAD